MSKLLAPETIGQKAQIVAAPNTGCRVNTNVDRTFELPKTLYAVTIACYLGFVGITALAFGNPALLIPMVVIAGIIVAGFLVPGIWTQLRPDTKTKNAMSFERFVGSGIITNTGPLKGRDAAIQVLILPVLVLLWGIAVVTIAALVS